jgi:pSer/pThr/pTyr-binding forkhead associated (FHA) protein
VILESINSIKENQYPLSVHILLFCENDYFILVDFLIIQGRGHDSDVRISDISVSRVHSKIFLQDNKLYLEDCGSKFGTLVLAKDQLEITESQKVIQIGRTLISTSLSNKSTM